MLIEFMGYQASVRFDADAMIFHGEVVGLRDVVTFQCGSIEAVPDAFAESIEDYLAFCRQRSEGPERPSTNN